MLGEVAVDDVDRIGETVPLHRAHVARFAVVRDGAAATAEMADPSMPKLDEMIHDPADTARVGGAHYVDRRASGASTNHDDRCPAAQFRQSRFVEFWAEQDECLAAEVQQCLDHRDLAMRRRHRTEHHLIPEGIGLGHDVLNQLSMKGIANIGHNADEM